MENKPTLSFCSTCMNRANTLQATLVDNLDCLSKYSHQVELCLVNFIKDKEGLELHQWISNLGQHPNLKYYVSVDLNFWHASIAKNTSQLNATGNYLINLDCDNYIDAKTIERLLNLSPAALSNTIYSGFRGRIQKKWRPWKKKNLRLRYKFVRNNDGYDGSFGNIGLPKSLFHKIGGYDQSLPPMGGQDADLLKRAVTLRPTSQLLQIPVANMPLQNKKTDGLVNTENPQANWNRYNEITTQKSQWALETDTLTANKNCAIGVNSYNGYNIDPSLLTI